MASSSAELVIKVVAQVQDAVKGLDSLASKASGVGSTLGKGVSRGINAVATATATVIGLTAAATAGVIAQGVSYNVLNQRARAAFTTVLGSASAADKMLRQIQKFASTSPFPRQAFIQATQQMLAFGFAAKDVIPTLDAVQNAVAASGGSSEDILEIVDVLAKVKSSGKITADTLNQLGFRGVDAAKIIGEQMGKTAGQIRESITKGTLGADKAISALTTGMAKKFAGAAEGLKGTWVGAVDRIKGAARDIGSALVEPFISVKGGGYAVVWANQVADVLRQLESEIGPMLTGLLGKLTPVFDAISEALGRIDLAGMFDAASSALSGLGPLLAPMIAALGALGGANLAGLLGPFESLVPTINPAVAALVALVAVMPELRSAFAQVLPILVDVGRSIATTLGPAIKASMPALHQLADAVGTVLVAAVKAVAPVIKNLVAALAPLLPQVADAAGAIAGTLAPAMVTVIGVIGKLIGWLTKFPGPLKAIATAIGAWVVVQWALNAALAANPISLVIIGITALIVLIVAAYQKSETFRAIVQGAWAGIAAAAQAAMAVIKAVWNAIVAAGQAALSWLKSNWQYALAAVLMGPFGIAVVYIVRNFDKVKAVARSVWNALKAGARAVGNAITSVFRSAFAAVTAAARTVGKAIRTVFAGVRAAVSAVASFIRSVFGAAWRAVVAVARAQFSAVRQVINTIRAAVSAVTAFIRDKFSAAWKAVRDVAARALGAIRSPIDGIRGAIEGVIDAVKSLIGWLGRIKVPNIKLPSVGDLNPFKAVAPTTATAPSLLAARALAATSAPSVPSARRTGSSSGGNVINLTVNGAIDPEATARQIRRVLAGHNTRMGLAT